MLNSLSATDVAILAAVLIGLLHYFDLRTARKQPTTAPAPAPQLTAELEVRLVKLETAVQGLPSLWETERARVEEQSDLARRAEARTKQALRRAEQRADRGAEDEAGEPELPLAPQLRPGDGARGGEGQLRALRPDLAAIASGTPPHKRTMGR